MTSSAAGASQAPLLVADGVEKAFSVRRRLAQWRPARVAAVDGVDLEIGGGETVGIVGESGCGKSTLARLLVGLVRPDRGRVVFRGQDLADQRGREINRTRRALQIVFQDPAGSLDPRMSVGALVREGLEIHHVGDKASRDVATGHILEQVGLGTGLLDRRPHELSGGQRQRVAIARALVLRPALVVADEPVSSLDVTVQAQILNLLVELRRDLGLTCVVVTHDLSVVSYIADRTAVMYLGRVVELAPTEKLIERPLHPYTVVLLGSVLSPYPDHRRPRLRARGEVPSALRPPPGCPFHPRCPIAEPVCSVVDPPLSPTADGRLVACHRAGVMPPPEALAATPPALPSAGG